MKRPTNRSKYDPFVEEVDILDVNPNTCHVRTKKGKELTVFNRHLAPIGTDVSSDSSAYDNIVSDTLPSDNVVFPVENIETITNVVDNHINVETIDNDSYINRAFGNKLKSVLCIPKQNIDRNLSKPEGTELNLFFIQPLIKPVGINLECYPVGLFIM